MAIKNVTVIGAGTMGNGIAHVVAQHGFDVTLASNTSSISITELAGKTSRPQLVIGMHFFNPVPVMKLVEIIRGLKTSDITYNAVKELTEKLEKTPVEVNDFPGFVSNRILV